MPPKLDNHAVAEVARRYRAGESVDVMAAEFGVTSRTIRNWLVVAKVKMRTLKQAWAVRRKRQAATK